MITPQQISNLYRQACEIELQAFKPGNVSIYADGHGMAVADFRLSAEVSAEALSNPEYSLGEKIYYAVQATRAAVGCNTNLGIILLCAPLVQAINNFEAGETLRYALSRILAMTTLDDASWVFKAITLAAPGGLGNSEQQDVNQVPTVDLTEAMRLACSKDRIALQYVTNYKDIFETALLSYTSALDRWGNHGWASLSVYADMLGRIPDSHIERKHGKQYSELVATRMAQLSVELASTDDTKQLMPMLYQLDKEFKSLGINPGTTADMTVATVFTAFLMDLVGESFAGKADYLNS